MYRRLVVGSIPILSPKTLALGTGTLLGTRQPYGYTNVLGVQKTSIKKTSRFFLFFLLCHAGIYNSKRASATVSLPNLSMFLPFPTSGFPLGILDWQSERHI